MPCALAAGRPPFNRAAAYVQSHGNKDRWEPRSIIRPKSVIAWGADTTQLAPTLEAQWGHRSFS